MLKVLSEKSRRDVESTRHSTAWTDDSRQVQLTESSSYTSLAVNGSSVAGLRNSRSAESLKGSVKVPVNPPQSCELETRQTVMRHSTRSTRNQSPVDTLPVTAGRQSVRDSRGRSVAVKQSKSGRSCQRPVMVHIELLSNWGHERLVGLTEVDLLDANERQIDVNPSSDVTVSAASRVNKADVLFNGKCKV